jgi:PPP family 3-phenylpropionic acid transporter
VLYALMYGAYGVASPFMPAFFGARGLTPEQIGILFGSGTAIRLLSGPLAARLADRTGALRAVLVVCELLAALAALALLPASGFTPLLLTSLLHAAALAPTTVLADTLVLGAARGGDARPAFEYGWVRGTGSAVFVAGTLLSGQAVAALGLGAILTFQAALLLGAAGAAMLVPPPRPFEPVTAVPEPAPAGVLQLLRRPLFLRIVLIAGLILGSHAMHDTFAVIRWSAAGVTPAVSSALWSESVVAEVVVFFLVGPALVRRLGPPGVMAVAAVAGVVRWVVVASSTSVWALALVQPLHGLTFAALHLACMRLIPAIVPPALAATAQAMYALVAGALTALLILLSGWLYAHLGAQAFLVMALLCGVVLPLTWGLRAAGRKRTTPR